MWKRPSFSIYVINTGNSIWTKKKKGKVYVLTAPLSFKRHKTDIYYSRMLINKQWSVNLMFDTEHKLYSWVIFIYNWILWRMYRYIKISTKTKTKSRTNAKMPNQNKKSKKDIIFWNDRIAYVIWWFRWSLFNPFIPFNQWSVCLLGNIRIWILFLPFVQMTKDKKHSKHANHNNMIENTSDTQSNDATDTNIK